MWYDPISFTNSDAAQKERPRLKFFSENQGLKSIWQLYMFQTSANLGKVGETSCKNTVCMGVIAVWGGFFKTLQLLYNIVGADHSIPFGLDNISIWYVYNGCNQSVSMETSWQQKLQENPTCARTGSLALWCRGRTNPNNALSQWKSLEMTILALFHLKNGSQLMILVVAQVDEAFKGCWMHKTFWNHVKPSNLTPSNTNEYPNSHTHITQRYPNTKVILDRSNWRCRDSCSTSKSSSVASRWSYHLRPKDSDWSWRQR